MRMGFKRLPIIDQPGNNSCIFRASLKNSSALFQQDATRRNLSSGSSVIQHDTFLGDVVKDHVTFSMFFVQVFRARERRNRNTVAVSGKIYIGSDIRYSTSHRAALFCRHIKVSMLIYTSRSIYDKRAATGRPYVITNCSVQNY